MLAAIVNKRVDNFRVKRGPLKLSRTFKFLIKHKQALRIYPGHVTIRKPHSEKYFQKVWDIYDQHNRPSESIIKRTNFNMVFESQIKEIYS